MTCDSCEGDHDQPGDDSTTLTVTVYDCPRDDVAGVVAIIRDRINDGETPGAWAPGADHLGTLFLGVPYGTLEARTGSGYPLMSALVNTAPDSTFTVAEHANCYGAGAVWLYTPTLGVHQAEADLLGDSRFTAEQIHRWVDEWENDSITEGLRPDPPQLRALLAERTGAAHRELMHVPQRRIAQQALRVAAGATVGMSPAQARRAQAAVRIDPWPRCASFGGARQIRPAGASGWAHRDSGRSECDPAVVVTLPGHAFHGMPARLLGPTVSTGIDRWQLELPGGCHLRVSGWASPSLMSPLREPARRDPRPTDSRAATGRCPYDGRRRAGPIRIARDGRARDVDGHLGEDR